VVAVLVALARHAMFLIWRFNIITLIMLQRRRWRPA
jgi:hypothetical protein